MKIVLGMPDKSGIYMIKNIITKQSYIGSASVLRQRCNAHRCYLLNNKHPNQKLQRSFNKYGGNAFVFGIIELCDITNLIPLEQKLCDLHKPFFNIREVVENSRGVKLSEETKNKMSIAHKGKPIHPNSQIALILSNIKRSGNQSEKTKAALRLGSISSIGLKRAKETRFLISQSKIGKKFNKETRTYHASS